MLWSQIASESQDEAGCDSGLAGAPAVAAGREAVGAAALSAARLPGLQLRS